MQALQAPFPYFVGLDGKPLFNGELYFGTENGNPETSPVTVYWDAAGTQPAAQPVRTFNGFPSRNGNTPALLYFAAPVSLTVRDSRGSLVLYAPSTRDLTVGFINPMTTPGDLIRGDTAGAAARLPVGTNGQVLSVVGGLPVWTTPVVGFANPMTAAGDLITGGALGVAQRLGVGTNGQILTVVAGAPAWSAAATPYAPPATLSFSARRSTNYTTAGLILFNDTSFTGSHNDSSFYATGTGIATIPTGQGGDFLVMASVELFNGTGAGTSANIELRINGVGVVTKGAGMDNGSTGTYAFAQIMRLSAGDTIAIHSGSTSGTLYVNAGSTFSCRRVSLT